MTEEITITFGDDTGLTQYQLAIVKKIYNISKNTVKEVVETPSIADALVVTLAVGNLVKLVENIKINDKPLSGKNKKEVVLFIGRLLLKDLLPDSNRDTILGMYDLLAEPTLEKLIDVGKNIKVMSSSIIDNIDSGNSNNQQKKGIFSCFGCP